MNIAEQIKARQEEREAKLATLEAVLSKASEENRLFTDAENEEFDKLKGDIASIDGNLSRLREMEVMSAARAKAVETVAVPAPAEAAPADPAKADFDKAYEVPGAAPEQMNVKAVDDLGKLDKGVLFARIAIAKALAKESGQSVESVAQYRWGETMAKFTNAYGIMEMEHSGIEKAAVPAGVTTVPQWAGELTQEAVTGFIEMLRGSQITSRLNMRQMDFGGSQGIRMPRQSAGVLAGYVGENQSIKVQGQQYDGINLFPYKLAVIVPASMELLRRSNPSIDTLVRDDMIASASMVGDQQFQLGVATPGVSPGGVGVGLPASNTKAASGANNPTVTQVTDDLSFMLGALRNANIPMTAPAWIMSPRTRTFLQLQRTTQETFAWRDELNSGFLLGIPVVDSTNVAIDLGVGTDESTIFLGDWNQVIYANGLAPTIDASTEATIQSADDPTTPPNLASNQYSAWQQDGILWRLRLEHDWQKRHDTAVATLTGVQWGA